MAANGESSVKENTAQRLYRYRKFVSPETNENEDLKQQLLNSDSCLIPIMLDQNSPTETGGEETKKAFLVHLQIRKMAVTVYTSEAFGPEENSIAHIDDDAKSLNSDEMMDTADEITIPATPTS